jgi:ABC-2 type transport system permease protein
MNYNLFIREMRFNTLSLILWMVIIAVLITVTMSVYPTFIENQSKVMGMISLFPKSALEFKGVSNIADLTSVLGFYAANNIIYMMVLGSIFSIVLSSNILLKEEYNKTAEILLTKPISRTSVFLSKLSVLFLQVMFMNLIAALVGFVSMKIVHKESFPVDAFVNLAIYTFLLNLLFGAIGLFMSTLVKRPRPVTTIGIGLVLVLYFVFTISKITTEVSNIGFLSPFKFVRTDVLSNSYTLEPFHLLYFGGLSLLLIVLAYRLYRRKDIYT